MIKEGNHIKTAIFIVLIFITTITCITLSFSLETQPHSETTPEEEVQEKPPIVDHFACSDYCPGPEDEYMVKIYEGVEDEEECRKLGGRPSTYVGWGTFHICIAE